MTHKTGADLVAEAKERIREMSPGDAMKLKAQKPEVVFLDVREPNEWTMAHVVGAVFIPRGQLESHVEGAIRRDSTIVVYCARANRSALAAETLQLMGYTDVYSLAGGFGGWVDAGGEVGG
ncbi:MAG: rhodanese-like domain-containing protein [Gemmatimonadaceae bacterium]